MPLKQQAKGMMLDIDTCTKAEQSVKQADLDLDFATTLEEAAKIAVAGMIDFVIIHEQPNTQGLELAKELWQLAPSMPMLVMCEAASGTWEAAVADPDPRLELVYSEASPQEIHHRLAKLLQFKPKQSQPQTRSFVEPVNILRNNKTGRLDAEKIAVTFGIALSDIARAVNKSYSTVHKTPDSAALQNALYPFERIAAAIKTITGGELEPGLKIWLNAPNKAFPKDLPVELIKQGHASMLADMLEDVLLGQPG
ncbi:MAG: hypothetical protein K2W95_12200 [Candidatus Obscuribacterales bacterium]|nr:hypothetical protein [Candidatus Obscuribacterales bacterium]